METSVFFFDLGGLTIETQTRLCFFRLAYLIMVMPNVPAFFPLPSLFLLFSIQKKEKALHDKQVIHVKH